MSVTLAASSGSELILSHDNLALNLANRCWKLLSRRSGHGLEHDDVLQEARIGLVQAAADFNPTAGASFPTWATYKIRGSLCDMLRAAGHAPQAEQFDIDNQNAEETAAPAPDNDTIIAVRQALQKLPTDQRELLEAVHFRGVEHADLAKQRGCSTKTIQRALGAAQLALKRPLTQ